MTTESQGRPDLPANVPTVALADARAELSKIVTLAEHTGRITAITRYGKPVAAVVPAALLHLLSGAHIGPRPIEPSEMERLADRARSADRRPTSDDITAAVEDVRAEDTEPNTGPLPHRDLRPQHIVPARGDWSPIAMNMPVRDLLAHTSLAAEGLEALPADLTMADVLAAWAEKQQGGSQ
ncbi:type II toxin-antitoxin system Phd/YefM family antitoxin [Kitasatospora sp. NPDC088134]|uniref:type II toxin-antitoxin system Phd/YefM family antitoxin n=1 Tax=Kitasatospora sp. NPDC088134 TaxID=3364071 RepID=UPI00381D4A35